MFGLLVWLLSVVGFVGFVINLGIVIGLVVVAVLVGFCLFVARLCVKNPFPLAKHEQEKCKISQGNSD